jgi:hypothetical protein
MARRLDIALAAQLDDANVGRKPEEEPEFFCIANPFLFFPFRVLQAAARPNRRTKCVQRILVLRMMTANASRVRERTVQCRKRAQQSAWRLVNVANYRQACRHIQVAVAK